MAQEEYDKGNQNICKEADNIQKSKFMFAIIENRAYYTSIKNVTSTISTFK